MRLFFVTALTLICTRLNKWITSFFKKKSVLYGILFEIKQVVDSLILFSITQKTFKVNLRLFER